MLVAGLSRAADLPPYSLNPAIDLPIIGLGLGMKFHSERVLAEARSEPLDLPSVDRAELHPMDRWAAGNYSPSLSSASGVLVFGQSMVPLAFNAWDLYQGRQTWFGAATDFILLQEALAISSSLVSYSKGLLKLHPTPLVYGSSAPESEKLAKYNVSSFFSGHTTAAFTTAAFSAYTFQLKNPESPLVPWVWGGTMAAAAGVGAMRIAAGKHFPSDVIAAAAVGSLVGYLVPRLHLRRGFGNKEEETASADAKKKKVDLDFTLSSVEGSSMPVPTMVLRF
jgi:membrane-associated phospholipid phosphatase